MSEFQDTNRWRGVLAISAIAVAVGLIVEVPPLLVVATVGVVYAVYPQLTPAWEPKLTLERSLSETAPANGERVVVETTVRNVGDRPILDLRFVDGVPPALTVVEGSPRCGAVLRPGAETTVTYEVVDVRRRRDGNRLHRRPERLAAPAPDAGLRRSRAVRTGG